MSIFLVIAGLFAAGFVANFFREPPLDPLNIACQLSICATSVYGHYFFRKQRALEKDFFDWLQANAREVQLGGARYKNFLVTPNTEVRSFISVVSLIFVTIKMKTRPFFPGEPVGTPAALLSTGTSLFFGWWGIPWGPIYTCQSLFRNLRGGERLLVRDLLADQAKIKNP